MLDLCIHPRVFPNFAEIVVVFGRGWYIFLFEYHAAAPGNRKKGEIYNKEFIHLK
jgi:hypothetical protein